MTVTYKGVPIRLSADFSAQPFQARRDWHEIIQSDEKQGPTTKTTLCSKIEGEIKSFPKPKKLKEFITTKPVLQEMVKEKKDRKKKRNGKGPALRRRNIWRNMNINIKW